uniref:SET domain-containing protein n=1 Tax=Mycena chlorophos TaxID=658473 RepID=A0ABQ0LD57_MYCCL|nr:predicted protein [Mycena chlorophos]
MRRGFLLNSAKPKPSADKRVGNSASSHGSIVTAVQEGKKSIDSAVPYAKIQAQIMAGTTNDLERFKEECWKEYEWISFPPPNAVAAREPVTECIFLPGTKQALFNTPGFPQPLPPAPTNPAYRVAPIPGKRLGLIATCTIKQGELILTERPLLIRPRNTRMFLPPNLNEKQTTQHILDEWERITEPAVARMTEERRNAFFKLHNNKTGDGSGPITGLVVTNGLEWTNLHPGLTGGLGDYIAVCDLISRLNHSCSPNTQATQSRAQLASTLHAVRDIAQGEELTIHYFNTLGPAAARAKSCKRYGFTCQCPCCAQPKERLAESDARRTTLREFNLSDAEQRWAKDPTLPLDWLVTQCLEQLDLLEKEGLQACNSYCVLPQAIMSAYVMLADAKRASKWAVVVNERRWIDDYVPLDPSYLDPKSPAYEKNRAWGLRMQPW